MGNHKTIYTGNEVDEAVAAARVTLPRRIEQLEARIGSNLGDLGTKVGVYSSVLFEIGNITINASGWAYGGSTTRVRLKEGFTLHLYEGDVISLTDYSDARYYLGWRVNGTYYFKGWNTTDFLVSTEADYVILLSNRTETAQTSIDALYSLLSIKTYNDNGTLLERVNEVIVSDPIDGINAASKINSKYVNYSTGAYTNTGTYFDVYQIENSNYISISINCGYSDAGAAAIAFYNDTPSASSYMQSYSVRGAANTRIYSAQIPDGCKYIAVTNRNSIVSSPTITLTQNKIDASYKDTKRLRNEFNEYVDSLSEDYAEELITTLTITSSSTSKTISSGNYSFKAGDVLKVVCEKTTPTNYGTFRFGATGYLTSNNSLVDGGIQYVAIPYAMTTNLYLIARELDYISISIYKVSRTDLADLAPHYFFDLQNSRCGQKGNMDVKWLSSGAWYVNYVTDIGYANLAFSDSRYRISTDIIYAVNPKVTIRLTDNTTYRYAIYTIKNLSNMTYHDSWWITDTTKTLQLYGQAFVVLLTKQDSSAVSYSDIAASGISIAFDHDCQEPLVPYSKIREVSEQVEGLEEQVTEIDTTDVEIKANDTINKEFTFGNHPCYGHLFIDTIGQSANPAIPCQSLFDVDATARLGFKYIETNVQTTSDGVLIPIHGVSGKFGYEVTDLNGNFTYADTLINSVTYEWIQQNIRYKTKYAKHRTSIPTLEDVFKECKSHGMSVMMTYNATTYALAKKYFNDNFIAYSGNRNLGFTGMIMHYSPLATKDEILARCDDLGAPYIHMLDTNAFDTFYNAGTLADLANAVHEKGCLLGIAGCYQTALQNIAFFEAGGDVNASGYFVNDFQQGNICNLKGDVDYSDFTITNGSVVDGVLTLASGGTISSGALSSIYLGKGSLRIRFNGTLQVTSFGHSRFTDITLSSDGTLTKWLSTYFLEQTPTFSITATESTEIYMIDYKASKV